MRKFGLMVSFPLPMVPFRLESIQSKTNEWEGANAGLYQIETLDLSRYGELVNQ